MSLGDFTAISWGNITITTDTTVDITFFYAAVFSIRLIVFQSFQILCVECFGLLITLNLFLCFKECSIFLWLFLHPYCSLHMVCRMFGSDKVFWVGLNVRLAVLVLWSIQVLLWIMTQLQLKTSDVHGSMAEFLCWFIYKE
jgi:hypothetical protein